MLTFYYSENELPTSIRDSEKTSHMFKQITDVIKSCCGDGHFAIFTNIRSLCDIPETNIML